MGKGWNGMGRQGNASNLGTRKTGSFKVILASCVAKRIEPSRGFTIFALLDVDSADIIMGFLLPDGQQCN